VWVANLITDQGDPDGRNVQTELADWIGYACHMGRLFVLSIPAVTTNFQNPSIIPAYSMTLFLGMLD
jgi:hypothetical protein